MGVQPLDVRLPFQHGRCRCVSIAVTVQASLSRYWYKHPWRCTIRGSGRHHSQYALLQHDTESPMTNAVGSTPFVYIGRAHYQALPPHLPVRKVILPPFVDPNTGLPTSDVPNVIGCSSRHALISTYTMRGHQPRLYYTV